MKIHILASALLMVCLSDNVLAHAKPAQNLARSEKFVQVQGIQFIIGSQSHHFLGTNLWYGINLGSRGPGGDQARLLRELDRLQALGVTNLRVVAASEGPNSAPFRMQPSLQTSPGVFDEQLLHGLDFLLVEMQKRDMHAIMCLGNFWQWSGGFAQYVSWADGTSIPYPEQFGWTTFENYSASFYVNDKAKSMYNRTVDLIVSRVNTLSGISYSSDPTIMAWELANEPRGQNQPDAYLNWVSDTAARIKQLDTNHLVTTGSEGLTASQDNTQTRPELVHALQNIDYLTFHIWIQNFGWYDPHIPATYEKSTKQALEYVEQHVSMAERLGKPAVFEEFGIARDGGDFNVTATTSVRDQYYQTMFEASLRAAIKGRPLNGVNFWAWAGEGRPVNAGDLWQIGTPFIGDPPHEPQGWYSVYDQDSSTTDIIKRYAQLMNSL